MPINQALLLDPSPDRRHSIAQAFQDATFDLRQASDFESALADLNVLSCEWLLVSDELPLDQLRELMARGAQTGQALSPATLYLARSEQSAWAGLQAGASDYLLLSELSPDRLGLALNKAEQTVNLSRRATLAQGIGPEITPSHSPAYQAVLQAARKLAHCSVAVLIQGESGSGKSSLARCLHRQSDRAHGPLWDLDCRILPSDKICPLIFGSEFPTPSGPPTRQPGLLELADRFASILLREVHLLTDSAQEKLVRFLHNQTFTRVGGKDLLTSNARFLATSSIPLRDCVAKNTFREDLFLILNTFSLPMPPMRERLPDIVPLAESFLRESARGLNKRILAWAPECHQVLKNHDWPGNLRELQQTVSRAAALCPDGAILEPAHLFPPPPSVEETQTAVLSIQDELAAVEKLHIFQVLKKCGNNRTHAARRLGISIRTLRNKLRAYRLAAETEALQAVAG